MAKLEVLQLLEKLISPCSYRVPDTGDLSYPADYVVNHESLCDLIAQAIQEEKSNANP